MKPPLLPLQSNMKVVISAIGILSCTCQIAAANPSLANQSLTHIASSYPQQIIQHTRSEKQVRLLKPVSKFDNLIDTVQSISQGAGLFGENVKTVIGKDTVVLQYSTQW